MYYYQENIFYCDAASLLNDRDGAANEHIETKVKSEVQSFRKNYIFENMDIFVKENGFVVIDLWPTWAKSISCYKHNRLCFPDKQSIS